MDRAISITQLYATRRNLIELPEPWDEHIGQPEIKGSWLIWGNSGNGKTSYALQLAKMLSQFQRVAYNGLEEGNSQSFEIACKRHNMHECKTRFILIQDNYENLIKRLKKHKSPNIIITDSFQYFGINYKQYKRLLALFPNKLFVWISHADGNNPEGRTAKRVRYDAHVKIQVVGYTATTASRYGGTAPYIVWSEGADQYNAEMN